MECKEFFKYVFIGSGTSIIIEADNKMEAIQKLQEEAPGVFDSDFQIINVKSEIKINNDYVRYL